MHSLYVSIYFAFRKGRQYITGCMYVAHCAIATRGSGNTRWHRRRTSIWRTHAKVARSALTRIRKCKSRTSTIEFDTNLSVIAMQRRRSDKNGRFEMEKNMKKLYLTIVNSFAQAKWQNEKKKKTNESPKSGRVAQNRRVTRLAGRNRNQRAHGARRREIRISVRVANRGKNR
jgi:hypothetical protein